MELERRFLESAELRADGGFAEKRLVGYAAVFNSMSDERMFGGSFREQVAPGAFKRFLRSGKDVVALFNHDQDHILGRLSNRTLTLREDDKGLWMEITLPETTLARDVYRLVERGDVRQMSFGFHLPSGGDKWERQGKTPVRTLVDLDLDDVSVVTTPAYPTTSVAARQFAAGLMSGADTGVADGQRRERLLKLLSLG